MPYRIMLIGAHPDDNELKGGGLAAMHLARGGAVKMLSLTDGCRGHHEMSCEETRDRRRAEMQAVAEKFGISYDAILRASGPLSFTIRTIIVSAISQVSR